jgi:hypothetical protein
MAIHTKVGILTQVPGSSELVTPGLINGLYADFLTKEFDFLDDSRMYPQDAWFTNNPLEYTNNATGDWEDIATNYRAWRDEYTKEENEYWLTRSIRAPFQYKNFVKDPSGTGNLNPLEWIRLVYPAPNGDFNMPYPNPKWSDGYSYSNSSYPLRHNMTRVTLPLSAMAWQSFRSSGGEDILENQSWVRDNQASIDAVQVSIDLINNEANAIKDLRDPNYLLLEPMWNELQSLINSGADQTLIDAKQTEYNAIAALENSYGAQMDAIYAGSLTNGVSLGDFKNQIGDLENNSQFIKPNTAYNRIEKFRSNRDQLLKVMNDLALGIPLSEIYVNSNDGSSMIQGLTEEDLATMKADFLDFNFADNTPNPWNDEVFRFAWGDGINPVDGASNGTIHTPINGDWGQNAMTNHPLGTMPFEVLPGVTKINRLPAVANASLLPTVGNPGDVIRVLSGDEYAWDPQNQEWSVGFYTRFLGTFEERMSSIRDAKCKAKNELALAMKPFTFAGLHIPSFCLSTSNEIVK